MNKILDNLKPLNELAFLSYKYQRDNCPDIEYWKWAIMYPSYSIEHFEIIYKLSKYKPRLN